jgi:Holliday junction resolvasome RuvABC DNA-binding subunit
VGATSNGSAGAAAPGADAFLAARDGLVGLGFRAEEAEAALTDADPALDAEALLRHGLERLRRK